MNCESVSLLLNAVLDGELSENERAEMNRHLDDCESCRQQFAELQALDATLKRVLKTDHAEPSLDRVMQAVGKKSTEMALPVILSPKHPERRQRRTTGPVIGTVLAIVVVTALMIRPGPTPVVAEVTMATGSVDVGRLGDNRWTSVRADSKVLLPAHSRIRTRDDSLCEIRTKADAVVRLNRGTELVVHDSEQIELVSGELWCRTPAAKSVEISKSQKTRQNIPEAVFTCPSSSETQWQATNNELCCTAVSSKPVELKMNSSIASCVVSPGDAVTFSSGSSPSKTGHAESADALSWQLPLLILRSPNDTDLRNLMTQLLAAAGRSKMSYLYEEQIRQLGPKGTLPLIAFVRSADSAERPDLRQGAMLIIADLAPQSSIGDLEALAEDTDPIVRRMALRALQRLRPDRKAVEEPRFEQKS